MESLAFDNNCSRFRYQNLHHTVVFMEWCNCVALHSGRNLEVLFLENKDNICNKASSTGVSKNLGIQVLIGPM